MSRGEELGRLGGGFVVDSNQSADVLVHQMDGVKDTLEERLPDGPFVGQDGPLGLQAAVVLVMQGCCISLRGTVQLDSWVVFLVEVVHQVTAGQAPQVIPVEGK